MEETKEYTRIRTKITARVPDPERKYRDSFERTIEVVTFDENVDEKVAEVNRLVQETMDLIAKMGGRVYSLEGS